MAADYLTSALIENLKERGAIAAGSGLNDSKLLGALTKQLRNYIPAFLKGLREEYLIATLSIAVTSATVPAPARAVGAALRTVKWTGTDGAIRQLPRIEPERRADYALTDSQPQAYYFQGNNLILVPAVASGTLVLAYQQRGGKLVLPTACGLIAGIATNGSTTTLTFDSLPNSFTSGSLYDLVSSAGNFTALALDLSVNSKDATTIVYNGTPQVGLAIGDYVCLAGETCIAQIPIELHDLLAQATAYQLASSTGSARVGAIAQALKELREQLTIILSPRSDGSARPIVNRSSLGRWGGW